MVKKIKSEGSIGSGFAYQYMHSITISLSGLLFYIYVARTQRLDTTGAIALFMALDGVLTILFSLGIGPGLQHFVSYHLARNEYSKVRALITKFSSILSFLMISAFFFVFFASCAISKSFLHSSLYAPEIQLLGMVLSLMIFNNIFNGITMGLGKFKTSALITSLEAIISYSSPVILLSIYGKLIFVVLGWIIGNLTAALLFAFSIVRYLRDHKTTVPEPVDYKNIVLFSFPIFLSLFTAVGAQYTDRFFVSYYLGPAQLAVYNFSLLLFSLALFLVNPLRNVTLSKFSELFSLSRERDIESLSKFIIKLLSYFLIPVSVFLILIVPSLIKFIVGSTFLPGYLPIVIILSLNAIFCSYSIMTQYQASTRNTKILTLSSVLSITSNAILSIIFIPVLGIIGAGIALSSIFPVQFIVLSMSKGKIPISKIVNLDYIKIWVSSLTPALLFFILMEIAGKWYLEMILYALMFVGLYLIMTRKLDVFTNEEVDSVNRNFPKPLSIFGVVFVRLYHKN